jgi:hypothetical protein
MKTLVKRTLVLATAAMCGCADAGTSPPAGLVGTLVIASYNGSTLPAHVDPQLGACGSMIVGGSLTTAEDGHVVFSQSYTTPCRTGSPVATESRTGTLSVAGTTITIALDPNILAPAQTYTGTLAGDELTLHAVNSSATPLAQTFVLVRR